MRRKFTSVQPFDFIRAKKIYIRVAVRLHPFEKNYIPVAVQLHPCNKNLHPCSRSQHPCSTAHRPVSHPFACRAFSRTQGFSKEHFRVRGHTFHKNTPVVTFSKTMHIQFETRNQNDTQLQIKLAKCMTHSQTKTV